MIENTEYMSSTEYMSRYDEQGRLGMTVSSAFLSVTYTRAVGSGDGNSYRTLLTIKSPSQPCEIVEHNEDTGELTICFVGSIESSDFEAAMQLMFRKSP